METPPLYIVDILGEVVASVSQNLYGDPNKIFYVYGRSIQITNELLKRNDSINNKGKKYPMIAVFQDFPELTNSGYYTTVKLPKIVIATLTKSTDPPAKRYAETFKPILYPIYQEFLRRLTRHKNIVGNDPGAFSMMKWDRPGTQPANEKDKASNFNDFIDCIELQNLELTFKTVSNCKKLI